MNKKPEISKKSALALKRLISEEFIAWQLYVQFVLAAKPAESAAISSLFTETANDELYDHHSKLVKIARDYGLSIPCTNADYQKYASPDAVKQLNTKVQKGKDLMFYVDEAIKSEEYAILSYAAALEIEGLPEDVRVLLLEIFYEEQQHLADLTTFKFSAESIEKYSY